MNELWVTMDFEKKQPAGLSSVKNNMEHIIWHAEEATRWME